MALVAAMRFHVTTAVGTGRANKEHTCTTPKAVKAGPNGLLVAQVASLPPIFTASVARDRLDLDEDVRRTIIRRAAASTGAW